MSANLPLTIRPVEIDEIALLRDLAEETFVAAFAADNSPEDMKQYIRINFSLEYITNLYRTESAYFFLAWVGQEAIGYLKLNTGTAQTEQDLDEALEIERIYVLPAFQGKGLGYQLLDFALEFAHNLSKKWVWLGVWDQNHGAIRFYERHGFRTFSQHDFFLGQDHQIDLLMKRKL